MLYVQVDVRLINHPKLKRLARSLDVSQVAACGHLVALWSWAAQYAPDGDLTDYLTDPGTIADGAFWEGDPQRFVDALLNEARVGSSVGFLEITIDGALILHDWEEYFGKVLDKRQADAERKRIEREAARQAKEAEERDAAKRAGQSEPRPAERPQHDAGQSPDVPRTSIGHPTDVPRMSALNVAQRNVNVAQRSATKRNVVVGPDGDDDDALTIEQQAARDLLLRTIPDFDNATAFVREHDPCAVAAWSIHLDRLPDGRSESIKSLSGLLVKQVESGKLPNLPADQARLYPDYITRLRTGVWPADSPFAPSEDPEDPPEDAAPAAAPAPDPGPQRVEAIDRWERWDLVLSQLQRQMTKSTFDTWLRGSIAQRTDGAVTIYVANQYAVDWLTQRLHKHVKRTVESVVGEPVEVTYAIAQAIS